MPRASLQALADIGPAASAAVPQVEAKLASHDPMTRGSAATALRRLARRACRLFCGCFRQRIQRIGRWRFLALHEMDHHAAPTRGRRAANKIAASAKADQAEPIIELLVSMGSDAGEALPELLRIAQTPQAPARVAAIPAWRLSAAHRQRCCRHWWIFLQTTTRKSRLLPPGASPRLAPMLHPQCQHSLMLSIASRLPANRPSANVSISGHLSQITPASNPSSHWDESAQTPKMPCLCFNSYVPKLKGTAHRSASREPSGRSAAIRLRLTCRNPRRNPPPATAHQIKLRIGRPSSRPTTQTGLTSTPK